MCLDCGFYNGRQVIDLAAKKDAREARMNAKREMIKGQQEAIAPTEADAVAEKAPVATEEKAADESEAVTSKEDKK